ncbi:TPA: cutinase family protein [Corynebacterium striatum]|nr:cutinase family protein [Corynebacterium striatum]HAT6564290.1 cutinase family protein [Corynebacterium striatum]HAT6569752.1 cutinase family protein [Corynebacterium striatum]
MPLTKKSLSLLTAAVPVVAMFGLSVPNATAQQDTQPADKPSSAAASSAGDQQCADVQLVLVNGTFDTSAQEDSNHDHGFGAKIAGPAMREANKTTPKDLSAGIHLEDEPASETSSAAPTTTAVQPAAATADSGSNDLWHDSKPTASSSASSSDDLWSNGDASSTEESSAPSASSDDLWKDAPANPSDEWSVEKKDEVEKDGVRIARTYVTYPAAAGGAIVPGLKPAESIPYADSMEKGAENTAKVIQQVANDCPNSKVFLAGHSQGAQVASTVAREIGAGNTNIPADKIAGVALFSDPTRARGVDIMQGNSSTPGAVPGTSGDNVGQVGDFSAPEQDKLDGGGMGLDKTGKEGFGELSDRVASWCSDGDLVCDLPIEGKLTDLVVGTAERLNLSDPEESLQAVSDTLGPAVQLGGVNDVKDDSIDFGKGGFKAQAVSDEEVAGETSAADTQIESSSSVAPSTASNASSSSGKSSGKQRDLIQSISRDGIASKKAAHTSAAGTGEDFIGDLGKSVIGAVNKIGGMALGKGITIVKKAVTVENLAQIVSAGVANPKAGLAVAAAKLGDAALEVLTPETVTGMADEVFKEVDVLGISGDGLAETAVQAAGHGQAHNSYGSRPATADGRTAIDATVDWAVASSRDVAGDEAQPQEVKDAGFSSATYSADEAQQALEQVTNFKKELMGS